MTQPVTTQAPARPARTGRADLVVLAVEAALVAAAVAVGVLLNHWRVPIHVDAPPLYARWLPHLGPGTPLALLVAAGVIGWGPAVVRRLGWRRLLLAGYATALAWTLCLALIDGWSRGLATRLTPQAEYLHDLPMVTSIPAMLRGFSSHILDFQRGSWATHVAGHPPGAFGVFVVLDRIRLSGGGPAALLCVLVGATAPVSVAVALRALGAEQTARAALPFLVLFPGAVWVGASADGLFTGVAAAGLALLAIGGVRGAVPGGLLLGFTLYLSYGLVLIGALALAVLWLRPGARRGTAVAAGAGVAAVVAAFTAAGFWWLTGYHLVVQRYYQGWAAERPYGYWVWADLACLVICAGPAVAPGLRRMLADPRRAQPDPRPGPAQTGARPGGPARPGPQPASTEPARSRWEGWRRGLRGRVPRRGVWLLPVAALLGVLSADLSGLSKAEVERIWLPYAVWLVVATAWLPARHRRAWLAAQAVTALLVNHLLFTGW
jgi:methylthioxylose transferase